MIGGPDYQTLRDWRDRMLAKAQATGFFVNLDSDYKENPAAICASRSTAHRAADLGVPIEDIGKTLELDVRRAAGLELRSKGEEYDVMLQARAEDRATPNDLANIFVRAASGELVPLSSFVSLKETRGAAEAQPLRPAARDHHPAARSRPAYSIGEALDDARGDRAGELPPEVAHRLPGPVEGVQGRRRARSTSPSASRCSSSSWCSRRSSRASSTRSSIMLTVPLAVTGGLLGALAHRADRSTSTARSA